MTQRSRARRRAATRRWSIRRPVLILVALAAVAAVGGATMAVRILRQHDVSRVEGSRGYVGSDVCGRCHALNYPDWRNTLHATMVQPATPETVQGDFEVRNQYWLHDGRYSGTPGTGDRLLGEMVRAADGYYAYLYDPSGDRMNPYRITHVVGTTYRQTYLAESQGVYFRIPLEWSFSLSRWINFWNRQVGRDDADSDMMDHLLNENGHWDEVCARCHTTGYRHEDGGQWAELGIACEACHGPGLAHVERFRDTWIGRMRATVDHALGREPSLEIVRASRLDARRSVSICGRCHQADIWLKTIPTFSSFRPGEDLSAHFYEVPLDPDCQTPPSNKTWPDTSPRGPGELFRSFIESRCFKEGGATCIDCHAPHKRGEHAELLKPSAGSDSYCLGCHAVIGKNVAGHTHHAEGKRGSHCYDCHLPPLLDGIRMEGLTGYNRIRTHQMDHIPYPESTVRFGGVDRMPNACNACHADRDPAWSVLWASRWWGRRAHVGEVIDRRIGAYMRSASSRGEKTEGL